MFFLKFVLLTLKIEPKSLNLFLPALYNKYIIEKVIVFRI